MTTDIRTLLAQPSESIIRPKPFPVAWYRGKITGFDAEGKSKNKGTPFVRVFFQASSVADGQGDIDTTGVDFSRRELRKDFYITPDSLYRFRDFLDAVLGQQPSRNLDARLADIRNAEVLFEVLQRQDENDAETVWNDVGRVASADGSLSAAA